jgi:hypothetical protein
MFGVVEAQFSIANAITKITIVGFKTFNYYHVINAC